MAFLDGTAWSVSSNYLLSGFKVLLYGFFSVVAFKCRHSSRLSRSPNRQGSHPNNPKAVSHRPCSPGHPRSNNSTNNSQRSSRQTTCSSSNNKTGQTKARG